MGGAGMSGRLRSLRRAAEAVGRPVAGRREVEFVVAVARHRDCRNASKQLCCQRPSVRRAKPAAAAAGGRHPLRCGTRTDEHGREPAVELDVDADSADGLAGALGMRSEFGGQHAHRMPL